MCPHEGFYSEAYSRSIQPEQAFCYPPDPDWFAAGLYAIGDISYAMTIRDRMGIAGDSSNATLDQAAR